MSSIKVSIGFKKGIYCVMLIKDGVLVSKTVDTIKDSKVTESSFLSLIYAFIMALRIVRNYLKDNMDCRNFIFEVNNSTLLKWLDNNYSKESYQYLFVEAVNLLHELPIKYDVVYSKKPMAMNYADIKYVVKPAMSGLDLDVEDLGE